MRHGVATDVSPAPRKRVYSDCGTNSMCSARSTQDMDDRVGHLRGTQRVLQESAPPATDAARVQREQAERCMMQTEACSGVLSSQ